jgi:hypothetical protein
MLEMEGHIPVISAAGPALDRRGPAVPSARSPWPAGQPGNNPWGEYPCGGTLDDEADFGGIKVPTRMRAGYFFGTSRWEQGEFSRAQITSPTFL